MGLTIHYNGRFNKNAVLSDLITEVREMAETFKWKHKIYLEAFPDVNNDDQSYDGKIYGISFTPPECETVSITFLSNFRMSSNVHLMFYGQTDTQSESDFLYLLSVKTQFAGASVHKTIIGLFRYLYKRGYFSELDVVDEGKFWETGDERLLEHKFAENGSLIDNFSLAVETIPIKQGESFENYFQRIFKMIDDSKKK